MQTSAAPTAPDPAQVEATFHRLAALSPAEQSSLLASMDPLLAEIVRRLLDSDRALRESRDDSLFVTPLESSVDADTGVAGPQLAETETAPGGIDITQASSRRVPAEDSSATQPAMIGDYRVLNLIAEGGQGAVYRADHPTLHRQVVIKIAKHQLNADAQAALVAEGRTLATLDHPNLAKVHDLRFQDGRPYLVMEHIDGRSLANGLRSSAYTPEAAAKLVVKIARGIHHAHSHGVIHKDLKPANVVIRSTDGEPKVIDFGLAQARTVYAEDAINDSVGGTIAYMAPEQARLYMTATGQIRPADDESMELDARVDVFALGAILFHLLTGEPPYDGRSRRNRLQMAAEAEFDAAKLDGAPESLKKICLRAMAIDRDDRFAEANELADALESWNRQPVTKSPAITSYWPLMAGAFVLIVLSIAALSQFGSGDATPSLDKPVRDAVVKQTPDSNDVDPMVESDDFCGGKVVEPWLPTMTLTHFHRVDDQDIAGELFRNGPVTEGDALQIRGSFTESWFVQLVAVNPDGVVQVCVPEFESESPSEAVKSFNYPKSGGFGFTDGAGQQTFVLRYSSKPLPPLSALESDLGRLADSFTSASGRWRWVEGRSSPIITERLRGGPRPLGDTPFFKAMNTLDESTGPAIRHTAISFPIEPVEEP
ncbi:MAG: serine/threonine-protein kinase [Planctomycetota bacterium]